MPVVRVKLPPKVTVLLAVVLVITSDATLTAPLKVVPPELVIVTVPISVPMVLETVTAPVVLIVRFDTVLPAVPAIDDRLIAFAIPVPKVNVTPSASVVAPKVMVPVELPPTVVFADTLTGVVPKFSTPLEAAIVPAKVFTLGAVAVKPPLNVNVPPLAPSVKVPVLLKVTALVMVPVVALSARL